MLKSVPFPGFILSKRIRYQSTSARVYAKASLFSINPAGSTGRPQGLIRPVFDADPCMALNDAQGSRVDFITSNATKAAGDDRKVVSEKDAGRGYAEGNHIGNRLHPFGNI
jgi:hypothetical protein